MSQSGIGPATLATLDRAITKGLLLGVVGTGQRQRVRVRILDVLLEDADGYTNTNTLVGHAQLDIAGRPPGRHVVRIPGGQGI